MSSFILVAATLILIKSKSLLPNLDLTSEEESDIKSLEERLRLYALFIGQASVIKGNFGKKIIFPPMERKRETLVFLPDEQISRQSMMTFAREVLGKMPKKVFLPEGEVKKVASIEEMIDSLMERIKQTLTFKFGDFAGRTGNREDKVTAIVGFLAILELVRQGILDAVQEGHLSDIIIMKNNETL